MSGTAPGKSAADVARRVAREFASVYMRSSISSMCDTIRSRPLSGAELESFRPCRWLAETRLRPSLARILAVIGVGLITACQDNDKATRAYRFETVDRGPVTANTRATGTINPVTTVLVGSQLSGQVVQILADYNSPVQAGQILARLDSSQIKARRDAAAADVQQAKADVAMRRAQVDRTRATAERTRAILKDFMAQRDRAQAQLADARRTFARQSELSLKSATSQQSLDTARTQVEVQAATLASSEAQIASQQAELIGLESDLKLAEANVLSAEAETQQREAKLRDAEIDVTRTDIRSPVEGVVIQKQIELGQTVAASLQTPTLFTVAQDLRAVEIWANIDEADVGQLKPGQKTTFTVNAYPNRVFHGTVKMVRLGSQTVQNVVTYTGVVSVDNSDFALFPGMTANLQVTTTERASVLRVPNAALRFRPATKVSAETAAQAPARSPESVVASSANMSNARERLMAAVQPTADQMAAIQAVLTSARSNAPALQPGMAREQMRAVMQDYGRDIRDKIAATLDPERRAKYEALALEMAGEHVGESGTPGHVYVLDPSGQPRPAALRLGVSDGTKTEVLSGAVTEGSEVIVGGGPPLTARASGPRPPGPRLF